MQQEYLNAIIDYCIGDKIKNKMKPGKDECDLKTCFLCKFCLEDWVPAIAANRKNFEVKKGESIFTEGEPLKGIYFIYSGKVKVHKYWNEEKELIIRLAQKGDMLGHLGLGNNLFYPITDKAALQLLAT